MRRIVRFGIIAGLFAAAFFAAKFAEAHEAYVLTKQQFQEGLSETSLNAFDALKNHSNLKIFLTISICVALFLVIAFFVRHSRRGERFDRWFRGFARWGALVIRLALAASFFGSAITGSIFGPELPLSALPYGGFIHIALFVLAALFLVGFLTEAAALISLVIFGIAASVYGWYLVTYFNYLGEIVVLLLFGSRLWSVDRLIFGPEGWYESMKRYESTLVRVCYGIALIYAAITIKLLHPILTVTVVKEYHLSQFVIFPSDPLLTALGAALAEMVIGLFILLGFETRFTVFISLVYITLSLVYFREVVWPHLMLYGISISLLINDGGALTMNGLFDRYFPRRRSAAAGDGKS